MDRADLHPGKPTVHRRWHDNGAILSGDAMLTLATQAISKVDTEVLPDILDLFNATAMEVYEGQQWDMEYEDRNDVTVDEYMKMIRLKTSVLLGCACKTGAIIARASEENARNIYEMAVNLGIAFQLQDD
jgi:geranylgeranyl diphosphate synthase type II